ncbi:hypothetical protein TI04_07375 [Achromatium sp. WMS2]|nr:hypothetical protein TI04_07375 [Achromatium sp. WMS2]
MIQPRLTILSERKEETAFLELYRLVSQLVAIISASFGGILAILAEPILLVWSGSEKLAAATAPILFWYSATNATIAMLILPFMLQFARGKLRLHAIMTSISVTLLVPTIIIVALWFGPIGTGKVHFIANLLFLVF